ncbi:MAG: secondary thiamine-phosphate synthase enzyme YjbQ [Acidobacteria bacterium]|nr:secondary thiamine-phosphate synthase enzyme YjbQ [Acidobacteriota bacterium]
MSGRLRDVARDHVSVAVAPALQPRRRDPFEASGAIPVARGFSLATPDLRDGCVELADPRPVESLRLETPEPEPRHDSQLDSPVAWTALHETLALRTADDVEFIDLTDAVLALVGRHRLVSGFVNVQTRHTTTAIVLNEAEPLLLDDFRRTLERVAPRLWGYAHDDFRRRRHVAPAERVNGHAHCRALVLPGSASINVADGALCLGRWQRVLFVELDGGQRREVSVALVGLSSRRGEEESA